MSSWLESGRPAILEALAAACDKVDERARAEIKDRNSKDEQLLEELEQLRSRVAQVDRLQQENESLREEIGRLRGIQDVQVVPPNRRIALGELSPNKSSAEQTVLTRKASHNAAAASSDSVNFKAVVARCKELDAKYKGARGLLEEHRLALRKRAKVIERWARHSDALQREIDQLRARIQSRPSPKDEGSIAQADEAGAVTIADDRFADTADLKRPSPVSAFEHEPPASPPSLVAVPDAESALSPPKRMWSEPPPCPPTDDLFRRTDSATTTESLPSTTDDVDLPPYPDQPIEADLVAVKVQLSSDPPIIVSTRSVRKRKHGKETPEVEGPRMVKLEHSSSSGPEVIRESHNYSPPESIDFDEEVHVPTPKKRRALSRSGYGSATTNLDTTPRPSLPLKAHVALKSYGAPNQSPRRSHSVVSSTPQQFWALRDTSPQSKKTDWVADGLVRTVVFTSNLALGIKDLADDGDAEKGDVGSNQLQRQVVQGRLDALLNSPSANTRPPISRDDFPKVQITRPVAIADGDNGTNLTAAFKHARDSKMTSRYTNQSMRKQDARFPLSSKRSGSRDRALKTASIIRDDMPRGRSLNQEDIPLRERPIDLLRPEDFKPNPLYNDGLTFVYDEVVRGKDARAALSGCIDPNCCGKTFRRFAEAELKSVGSSVTKRAEDVGLMERYLGDEAFKLGMMAREEREEVWLKAKTWELANKFGKHRQRYSRMPSPPGFWNMDFPNTQERAEELRQAEEIRKALVNERHREAMRCEGSWLFRDEEPR
ncbi:hypothetical protein N0V93_000631 [Gnomoniopsis smithogilvyi]|uniref:DNA endonuclease activator Ctp1 C-terminal domain-containing protein n=1 Tax=Gnomoniopsis smithogilvyi TaxID=1191159 RepID=A0A9W8Z058_9PEZI|nr:hypothetical protein N0V93_000631 [Gnomoniopsis smithogilvyi]